MKRTLTRMVSAICAAALGIGCFSFGAGAKVIEPEIVKTEKWTASYFIDDDMEKLYPYLDCQADIYNDGTVKCYYWNTHEWDGFNTVKHTVTPAYTIPVSTNSTDYLYASAWLNGEAYEGFSFIGFRRRSDVDLTNDAMSGFFGGAVIEKPVTSYENHIDYLKLSSFPIDYTCSGAIYFSITVVESNSGQFPSSPSTQTSFLRPNGWSGRANKYGPKYTDYECALPSFPVNKKWSAIFTPKSELKETHTISYLGHDITITPELLSGNIVSEPELTEQEQKIKQLEAENAALKAQLAAFDSDADGLLTTADAQMILIYYTEYLAGAVSGTTGEYAAYIKQFKGQ